MPQTFYLSAYNSATGTTDLDAVVPGYQALTVVNEQGPGIVGQAISSGPEPGLLAGVIGQVFGVGPGYTAGVIGSSDNAQGVIGLSTSNKGVTALTGSGQEALYVLSVGQGGGISNGIYAQASNGNALYAFNSPTPDTDAPAIYAETNGPWAAAFGKDVIVFGNFYVFDGGKHAVLEHPDGSHRALYSMEAPEAWFEDFGRASLARGSAAVALETRFAALVGDEDYHVFVTPEGDCKGVCVVSRSREGFVVRECQDGTSDVAFSYRLAVRRTDIVNERFKAVKLPERPKRPDAEEAVRQAEELLSQAEQAQARRKPPAS